LHDIFQWFIEEQTYFLTEE